MSGYRRMYQEWSAALDCVSPHWIAPSATNHRQLTDTERSIVYALVEMAAERSSQERAKAVLRSLDSAGYEIVRRV